MTASARRQAAARRHLHERSKPLARVLNFTLPARPRAPKRRRWVLVLSQHAMERAAERSLSSEDIFASLWLGTELMVRGDQHNPYRVSYLFRDVVVIASPSPSCPAEWD